MLAGAPDYQFLKDFIDMMVGILFIIAIIKFTVVCVKYVLSPFKAIFNWIGLIRDCISEKSKCFIEKYEKEKILNPTVKDNEELEGEDNYNHTYTNNVVDFSKIKKK